MLSPSLPPVIGSDLSDRVSVDTRAARENEILAVLKLTSCAVLVITLGLLVPVIVVLF